MKLFQHKSCFRVLPLFRFICCVGSLVMPGMTAKAQNYTVNSSGDTHATSPTTSPNDGSNAITLRSAMEAATQIAGTHIITIPASITVINLSLGQITVGSAAVGNNITLNGPGKTVLTINQTTASRIFSTGTGAVTFSLNDLTLNYNGPAGTISGGGGAIVSGGVNATTSLTNVAINNFNIQIGNGGAISCSTSGNNTFSLTNCDFSNNYAGGGGGAVSYNGNSTCTIVNCNFNNNQTGPLGANTGGSGGALSTTGTGSGGTYSVTNCNFTNNKVLASGSQGGAIINGNGALTVNFCRFVNNTAATPANGNTIAQIGGATVQTVNSNNNWWGDNAPDATDNVVLAAGGSITVTKWLQLKTTVASNPLCAPATTTVTASFLSNSANEAVTTGNISKLIGLPITFANPTLGTLSAAQSAIQANGTATVTFTPSGTAGTAGVDAKVDNIPNNDAAARVSFTVNIGTSISGQPSPVTTCSGTAASFTVGISGGTPTYQWRKGTTNLSNGNTGTGSVISGATSSTLSITNAGPSDAASDYNVVVTPSCGAAQTSNSVQLTIPSPAIPAVTATASGTISSTVNNIINSSCNILGKLVPTGTGTALGGNVTSTVTVNPNVSTLPSGTVLLARHYDITPSVNAATATANVTLYFLQSEFTQFNNTAGITQLLPASTTDPQNYAANIRIMQYHGTGTAPGNYTGSLVTIIPTSVLYNNTYNCWEVTFPVTGFSGFYLTNANGIALPLNLLSFTGTYLDGRNILQWETTHEVNTDHFIVERSADAIEFKNIGTVIAKKNSGKRSYSYPDALFTGPQNYYRLRMCDEGGGCSYSKIVAIRNDNKSVAILVNPVPFDDLLKINITTAVANNAAVVLTNVQGLTVQRLHVDLKAGSNVIEMRGLEQIPQGVYFLKINNAQINKTIKIVKAK